MAEVIQYWSRETQKLETELVYGDAMVKFLYGSKLGQFAANSVLSRAFVSKAYGALQSAPTSRKKIPPFIKNFKIDMNEFEAQDFGSFNDFFIRKFKPAARPLEKSENKMAAFTEARYFGYAKMSSDTRIPVKSECLSPRALLANEKLSEQFAGEIGRASCRERVFKDV